MDLKDLDKKACWCEEKKDSSLGLNTNIDSEEDEKKYRNLNEAIMGYIDTEIVQIPKISTKLTYKDTLGCIGIRLGINRKNYAIKPGIYAVGKPTKTSPVLVTANYKFTFDKLRKELDGLDIWIMVIDTKGINVWCAAGKGTFGHDEIIRKIKTTELSKVVAHRVLILPQLAAPGVSAKQVTKATGFRIIYGPIRAEDLKEFIKNRFKASERMRKVTFTFKERLELTPLETIQNIKYLLLVFLLFFIVNYLLKIRGEMVNGVAYTSIINLSAYFIAILIGTVVFPILLPYLPFRAFSLKGLVLGVFWAIVVINFSTIFMISSNLLSYLGNGFLLTSLITYLALNFTGSTPYTCFSGVLKETLYAVPTVIICSLVGGILLIIQAI